MRIWHFFHTERQTTVCKINKSKFICPCRLLGHFQLHIQQRKLSLKKARFVQKHLLPVNMKDHTNSEA